MARFLEMDRSSLEEMAVDLIEIQEDISLVLNSTNTPLNKCRLESARYRLATYLEPICCVCGESPARYTNDTWYCTKCVEVENG